MIDLNKKPRKQEEDTPVSTMILVLMPMAWLFWTLIEWGLR